MSKTCRGARRRRRRRAPRSRRRRRSFSARAAAAGSRRPRGRRPVPPPGRPPPRPPPRARSRRGSALRRPRRRGSAEPAGVAPPSVAEDASPPPPLFVPGRVFHLRRDAAGAGASSARVSRHVGTLARVELSSSLVSDHSLVEYGEALETLALRAGAKVSPRVEVAGPLEWREVNPHVDRLNRNAPLVAALGGLAVSGPLGAIAAGGAAMRGEPAGRATPLRRRSSGTPADGRRGRSVSCWRTRRA